MGVPVCPESTGKKEGMIMFLGLEWYWWLVMVAILIISIPFKVKFLKWWSKLEWEKNGTPPSAKKGTSGKWGDEE